MSLTVEQKFRIITRNLQEVLGSDTLYKKLENGQNIKIYWGTAPTGKPHVAYFVPITKIADFLHAGCDVTILLADLHAFLDNMKAPWELLEYRVQYYETLIKAMLEQINVPIDKLKFVRGTSYQLTQKYTLDTYKLFTLATEHDCKKAGSEVVKQIESPCLSGLLYPGLQALDEVYLDVDAQFGGVDQRKIFTFAEKYLPKMGYTKRIHLMNPMVPGLTGDKMSASIEESKIDLLDSAEALKSKIKKSFCEEGNIKTNGVLGFCKHVIFPIIEYHSNLKTFEIKRTPENGGDISIDKYQELEDMFAKKLIHPLDLKNATFSYINTVLAPIRQKFSDNDQLTQLVRKAYPPISSSTKGKTHNKNNPSIFLMQCGTIMSTDKHPSLTDVIVVQIDIGSAKRTACVKSHGYELLGSELLNKNVVVVTNIKENNFKGVRVDAQIILSKKTDICPINKGLLIKVAPLCAPINAVPGESVYFEGYPPPIEQNNTILNPNKLKFDQIYDMIDVDDDGCAFYNGGQLVTRAGSILSLFKNAIIV